MAETSENVIRKTVLCTDCGKTFYVIPTERWKRVCRHCYKGEMDARVQLAKLRKEGGYDPSNFKALEAENEELRRQLRVKEKHDQRPTLDAARIRQLIQLCHPDKHDSSAASNEVTAWLLQQRHRV